jgi:hypothetical protein
MTTSENVIYSRTTILPDGSQQVEQFMLTPLTRAFVDRVLGEPHVVNLLSAEQAGLAREAVGTYAQVVMGA